MQKYVPGLGGCCALPACGEGWRAGEQLPSFRRFHHRQVLRPPEMGWVGHGARIPTGIPPVCASLASRSGRCSSPRLAVPWEQRWQLRCCLAGSPQTGLWQACV